MFGDGEVKDLATLVLDHQEHEQYLQADRWHSPSLPGLFDSLAQYRRNRARCQRTTVSG